MRECFWRQIEVNEYLVHCAKNSRAKGFDFLQIWGPQNAGMNLGTFLSWSQWLKALPETQGSFPDGISQWKQTQLANAACSSSLSWTVPKETHLSALQVPPHGSLAADSQTSVVQHTQEKQNQAENQTSRHT